MAGYIGNVQSASLIDNNSVKTAVQSASDSNVFSDADHSKLDGIAAGATVASQPTINVTVAAVGGSNKFIIDGTSQQTITMAASGVYKFDQSHSSNANHPLKISLTSNGTHGGGSAITTDFVAVGTAGQAGAYVTFTIQQDGAETYYFYCANHSGMGGEIKKLIVSGGGGEQTFTAGAAINAGDLVSIKTNGTIQKATGETSGIVTISGSTPEPEGYTRMSSAFNGTDKIVIVYHEHADNIVAYVGTITNGSNLSWGSKVTVASSGKTVPDVCYDSNAGKFLVLWRRGGSLRGEAAVGTVSGTSISFGSTVTYDSGGVNSVNVRYDDNAQKSMILYGTSNSGVKAVVATISGTSVSFGTALTIQNNGDGAGSYLSLLYDNNANKFVAVFNMTADLRAIVLTISGTGITHGSNHDFGSQYPYYMQAHFNKNENKVVVVWYRDQSPAGWVAVAGSISGTSFSTGTIWSGNIGSPSQGYEETAQKSYTFVDGGVYREFAFSGNNVSVLATPTRNYAPTGNGSTIYSLAFNSYAGPKLNFFLWEYGTLVSTLLQSAEVLPWVGIAAENISNGATGKVTVAGGINTSVSGLTAGLTYGLPANSAVITSILLGAGSDNRIFGTALSSTSIYIDKGTLR